MTDHINLRTAQIIVRRADSVETATRHGNGPSRRNLAKAGVLLVLGAAAIGVTQLAPTGSSDDVVDFETVAPDTDLGAGRVPIAGRPDGYWTPASVIATDSIVCPIRGYC